MAVRHAQHQSANRAHRSNPTDDKPTALNDSDLPVGGRVVPVPGLVFGPTAGSVRRYGDRNDPLGGSMLGSRHVDALARRRGGGQRLPADLARSMGGAMGADLDSVRVHTGTEPAELARTIQASAFTQGTDIYFGAGSYAPHTISGQRLLAHELAHTVQRSTPGGSGGGPIIGLATDPAEAEADRIADNVMTVLRRQTARQRGIVGPSVAETGRPGGLRRLQTDAAGRRAATQLEFESAGQNATQLVARAGRSFGQPLSRSVIRRAGAKIAFAAQPDLAANDAELVRLIGDAIRGHRVTKRGYKDSIEHTKDQKIEKIAKPADEAVKALPQNLPGAEYQYRRGLIQDPAKEEKLKALRDFHEDYQKSGWDLEGLLKEIVAWTDKKVEIGTKIVDEIPILNSATKKHIYSIFLGKARFDPPIDRDASGGLANSVYKKKGTPKHYIQDAQDIFIGRYAYRGCTPEQINDLCTKGEILPRRNTDVIGLQFEQFDFGGRGEDDSMTIKERMFIQQRDGSKEEQRMLSVTHAKDTRKVHSNHGAEFTGSATIKIDLAKLDRTLVYNLHLLPNSDKVALPRKGERKGRLTDQESRAKELDTYIYSAERNRETLLLKIPEAAVVHIKYPNQPPMEYIELKRLKNPEFKKKEQQKEKEARDTAEAIIAAKRAAEKQVWEQKQAAESVEAERSAKDLTQSAERDRRKQIRDGLGIIATRKKGKAESLETLWANFDKYLVSYETQYGLLGPLLIAQHLDDLIKLVESKGTKVNAPKVVTAKTTTNKATKTNKNAVKKKKGQG